MTSNNEPKARGFLSKIRYKEIENKLQQNNFQQSDIDIVLATIRDVLQFDPGHNGYLDIKPKLAEKGTTYNHNKKNYYEKNKAEISRKAMERYRKKRDQLQHNMTTLVAAI